MNYSYNIQNIQYGWSINTIRQGLSEYGFRVIDIDIDKKSVTVEMEDGEAGICSKILNKLGFPLVKKPSTQADKLVTLMEDQERASQSY